MKFGAVLPIFSATLPEVVQFAQEAEEHDLDGVFSFDHLFDRHHVDRKGLAWAPTLGAISTATSTIALGTLVARVGVIPIRSIEYQFVTLHQQLGDRLIAGLGVGDKLSNPEDDAYGVKRPARDERLRLVAELSEQLRANGIRTWLGGRSEGMRALAREHADGSNLWRALPEEFGHAADRELEMTWAGTVDTSDQTRTDLRAIAAVDPAWIIMMPRGFADWREQLDTVYFLRDELA